MMKTKETSGAIGAGIPNEAAKAETEDILEVEGINRKGFGIISKFVMKDLDLSIESKTIYAYLCSYAGAGSSAFPSRSRILYDLQISKNAYYRHYNALIKEGYIKAARKKTFPYNNIYTIVSNPKKFRNSAANMPVENGSSRLHFNGLDSMGYGKIPKLVMQDQRLPLKAKGIYAFFCSLTGSGHTCFPKKETIMHQLGISHNTYQKFYKKLIELDYLQVVQRNNGCFHVNDYYLNNKPKADTPYTKNEDNAYTKFRDNGETIENMGFFPYTKNSDNADFKNRDIPHTKNRDNEHTKNRDNNKINNDNTIDTFSVYQSNIEKDAEKTDSRAESIEKKIMHQIGYENQILQNPENRPYLDFIVKLMMNIHWQLNEKIQIGAEMYPAEYVKHCFEKLQEKHISGFLKEYLSTPGEVRNLKAYILTGLFNAYETYDLRPLEKKKLPKQKQEKRTTEYTRFHNFEERDTDYDALVRQLNQN